MFPHCQQSQNYKWQMLQLIFNRNDLYMEEILNHSIRIVPMNSWVAEFSV